MFLDCNTGNSLKDDSIRLLCILGNFHIHKSRIINSKPNNTHLLVDICIVAEKHPKHPYFWIKSNALLNFYIVLILCRVSPFHFIYLFISSHLKFSISTCHCYLEESPHFCYCCNFGVLNCFNKERERNPPPRHTSMSSKYDQILTKMFVA